MAHRIDSEEYIEQLVEESIESALENLGMLNDELFPASLVAQLECVIEEFEGWEEFVADRAAEEKEAHGHWLYQQMKYGDM